MLFSDINILDSDYQVRPHMYVGTAKDRIAYIGEDQPAQTGLWRALRRRP